MRHGSKEVSPVALLEHDVIISHIIRVIKEIRNLMVFVGGIGVLTDFPEKRFLENAFQYAAVTTLNDGFLREMLRKLKDEALIQVYNDCRTISYRYKFPSMLSMRTNIEIAPADAEYDWYHFDRTSLAGFSMGWEYLAPQREGGYSDEIDEKVENIVIGYNNMSLRASIHGTLFRIGENSDGGKASLRLWKGYYWGVVGGEIGFYGVHRSISNGAMREKVRLGIDRVIEILGLDTRTTYSLSGGVKRRDELSAYLLTLSKEDFADDLMTLIQTASLDGEGLGRIAAYRDIAARLAPAAAGEFIRSLLCQITDYLISIYNLIGEDDEGEFSRSWGHSLDENELRSSLGLTGTTMQVFHTGNGRLITEHREYTPEYWTTSFVPGMAYPNLNNPDARNKIYTVNHFYFEDKGRADYFYGEVNDKLRGALSYRYNYGETIRIPDRPNDRTVIIVYGKES
jgi:hypothetical protein